MFFSDEAGFQFFSLISVCPLCSLGQVFRLLLLFLFVLFICIFVLALGRFQVFVLPKSGSPTCVDIIFVGRTYEFRTSWISFAFPTLTLLFIISSFNVQHGWLEENQRIYWQYLYQKATNHSPHFLKLSIWNNSHIKKTARQKSFVPVMVNFLFLVQDHRVLNQGSWR